MSQSDLKCEILKHDLGQFDLCFKLIIVGDSGVGKSCLAIKAIKNYFEDLYAPTVGFEFLSFNVKIDDQTIKLQIWDTCGQEAYRSLINSFYRNSSLAILVYSIDNNNSFSNLETWLNEIKAQSNPDIKIFLIGNKADLEDKREVTKEMGENFANTHKLTLFMETSAKTGFNAQNLFTKAATILYTDHLKNKDNLTRVGSMSNSPYLYGVTEPEVEEEDNKPKKKGCVC